MDGIVLDIDRLIIEGADMSPSEKDMFQRVLQAELAGLLQEVVEQGATLNTKHTRVDIPPLNVASPVHLQDAARAIARRIVWAMMRPKEENQDGAPI